MDNLVFQFLNYFFYALHTVLILFNLCGWLFPRWRKLNLISLIVTLGSWIVLGFWKGWGYCFLTDWHYSILHKLGEKDMPSNYIAFLIKKLTNQTIDTQLIDYGTVSFTLVALICSLWFNYKSRILDKS